MKTSETVWASFGVDFGREERFLDLGLGGIESAVALLLVGNGVGGGDVGAGELFHFAFELGMVRGLVRPRVLGGALGELDDRFDHRLEMPVAEHDRVKHDLFGQLLGFRFDHQHRVSGAGDHEVERRLGHLIDIRIEYIIAVDVADARRPDRAEEGNAGQRQRRGGGDHGDDIGIVFEVMLEHGDDDLGLALEAGSKERPDRSIDQARNQRFLFGRPSLALEIAARDLAGGIGLFLVVDRQREEVLAGLCFLGGNDRRVHDRLAVGGDD